MMLFKTASASVPENPILDAGKRSHNDRYLSLSKNAQNWRLALLASLVTNVLLAGLIAHVATKSTIEPYLSVIDSEYKVLSVGPAASLVGNEKLRKSLEQASVIDFIQNARMISADPLAQVKRMEELWMFAAEDTRTMLTEYYEEHSPGKAAVDGKRVTVEITSALLRSDRTWDLRWVETHWSSEGNPTHREHWQGSCSIDVIAPTDARVAVTNPLGIYVTGLSWSQRIN